MIEFERNGIFTLDSKGNFKSFDTEKILGYREDELIGKRFTKLLSKKFLPAALELFQRVIKSKSSAAEKQGRKTRRRRNEQHCFKRAWKNYRI